MNEVQCIPMEEGLKWGLTVKEIGFTATAVWNPSPSMSHRTEPWPVPKEIVIGPKITQDSGSRFSPPPYAVVVENGEQKALVAIDADAGWHRWNDVTFMVDQSGVTVKLDLERQTPPGRALPHVRLRLFSGRQGETRHELLARGLSQAYPRAYKPLEPTPSWWSRPIYCGWGDQVTMSMHLEGPGPEPRAVAYCTQGLYERWIKRLEEAGVPIGTVLIDYGWSPAGVWQPDWIRWPDLRGFIRRQHEKGRRVLLWLATWLWDGLDDELCIFAGEHKLTADPTNPKYMARIAGWVDELISPRGYDADGFKIDQLAYCPSYRRPCGGKGFGGSFEFDQPQGDLRQYGEGAGVELLYRLQKQIFDAAKSAKPDALISSSTVHPYFHDTFDMVRLHDLGVFTADIFKTMRARADLSRAALPGKVIDADNWIHTDYDLWLRYTMGSRAIGVPCIFFAERFMLNWASNAARSTVLIPMEDLQRIAEAWKEDRPSTAG
ncbi:MAG: hypothetical protein IT446_08325 [Phycisphaerales bacterium]|nr:hypothetical protein [Phycisphaerales bacterium]